MSQFDPEDIKAHRVLFLVSWIETSGNIRGQTQKTREDADRLFNHLKTQDNVEFIEVRKIGAIVDGMRYQKTVQ